MSTGVIIALIVIVAVVVVAAALVLRSRGSHGGPNLKRRFGPEYDRTVARHGGDREAAERELTERVERHGALREQPLEPAAREQFEARWTAVQEHFVDSPREALAEADQLLAEVADARGFPADDNDNRLDALSVHHADHVHGYRRVRSAAGAATDRTSDSPAGTEEMREALVEARALFQDLVRTENGRGTRGGNSDGDSGGRSGRHLFGASNQQPVKGS